MHTVLDEIALMRRLMDESQRAVREDGRHLIVWGVLVTIGLLLTYASVRDAVSLPTAWIWMGVFVPGWAFSVWAGLRAGRRARVRTAAGQLLAGVWVGMGVALTLLTALAQSSPVLHVEAMSGLTAILLGAALFASSFLLGSWLRWLAAAWWGGGAVILIWHGTHVLLLMAVMMCSLLVAPGLVLFRRATRSDARTLG